MRKIETREELRQVQLGILDYIDAFCKKNGLQYYLCAGTLIGAVRHKGYIPWDDDIDIMMLRSDYEKLYELFNRDNDSEYELYSYRNRDDYFYPFMKVVNTRTSTKLYLSKNAGVDIDIFPIDDMPDDEKKINRLRARSKRLRRFIRFKASAIDGKKTFRRFVKSVLKICVPISSKQLARKMDKNASQYNNDPSSKSKATMAWSAGFSESVMPNEVYQSVTYLPFEGRMCPAPSGWDTYLSMVFGDYMQLPPEDKRGGHDAFTYYWKD